MRILILHAGKSGGSRQMAELLGSLLPNHAATVADVAEDIPPAGFDYIVFGGAIRMGRLMKPARKYLALHGESIAAMPHTLYLLCAYGEQFENYAEMVYDAALLESAEHVVYFGGELDPSKHRGIDRLLVRSMRNSIKESEEEDAVLPGLLPEHVRMLADQLRLK